MSKAPLALTMGDPAGIGPELILAAWLRRAELHGGAFVALANADLLADLARRLARPVTVARVDSPVEAAHAFPERLPVIDLALARPVAAGQADPGNGAAVIAAIDRAVALAFEGEISSVVTCPISKETLKATGFAFPGHTEYLAALAARHTGGPAPRPVMMLASDALKVVPLTIHIPLAEVPAALDERLVVETIEIVAAALRVDFGCAAPRIAVAGLNPHAGEGGTIGREEVTVIRPALDRLRARGLDVRGPLSADTMFHDAARRTYDAAVAMYHDQALIPIKTLAFDTGVNVTLGLPFVRTSPDHGTAFDIAGKGLARVESLMAALCMAREIAGRRRASTVRRS